MPEQRFSKAEVVERLESTLVRPNVLDDELKFLCDNAKEYGFSAVIVNPQYVKRCAKELKASAVKVGAVIGFPLGTTLPAMQAEMKQAIKDGAQDLDVVAPLSDILNGRWDDVKKSLKTLLKGCTGNKSKPGKPNKNKTVKLIVETCYLTPDQLKKICEIAVELRNVRYIKTSTGYGSRGATVEDVVSIVKYIKDAPRDFDKDQSVCEVKASGGIHTLAEATALANAGAARIGTSWAKEIADEKEPVQQSFTAIKAALLEEEPPAPVDTALLPEDEDAEQ
jgi:deoxyribose-phosphate aldolase